MNRRQRKWHGRIWGILSLVLPILGFWSLQFIAQKDSLEPPVLNELRHGDHKMPVQMNWDEEEKELVLVVNQPLASAATGVLLTQESGKSKLIGQIEGTGVYRFPLDHRPGKVVLQDLIKKQTLYSF